MATEIERKFLTVPPLPDWTGGDRIVQGMLAITPNVRVRVRGGRGYLTVKGPQKGLTRPEWEYEVPVQDALEMLDLCTLKVEKTRYEVEHEGHVWEVDVFEGLNAGLVVAEIELQAEDEAFERPFWVGEEVTHDPRYLNTNLAKVPFTTWGVVGRVTPA